VLPTLGSGLQKTQWECHIHDVPHDPEYKVYPSRPRLTSYALEYGGALRMIRVSVFSNDLMPQGGGQGLAYIGRSLQHEPLDQTDLRNGGDAT
jgi:hypothetical protein